MNPGGGGGWDMPVCGSVHHVVTLYDLTPVS